jgi:hypothetical protein
MNLTKEIDMPRTTALIIILLCSLVGCGAPDGRGVLGDAQTSFERAGKAADESKWADVRANVSTAISTLQRATKAQVDGKPMSDFIAPGLTKVCARLDANEAAFMKFASETRENFVVAEECARDCNHSSLQAKLQANKKEWTAHFDAADAAKLAADQAAAAKRHAESFVFWVEPKSSASNPDLSEFRAHVLTALQERFAPVPVEFSEIQPPHNDYAGSIILRLAWENASYGDKNDPIASSHNSIPESVAATLIVKSPRTKTSLDGPHVISAKASVPDKIDFLQNEALRIATQNRKSLTAEIERKIRDLPKLVDAPAVVTAIAAYKNRPPPTQTWTLSVNCKSSSDERYAPTHDFKPLTPDIVDALQERFESIQLVPEDPAPVRADGHVSITITTTETAYGHELGAGIKGVSSSLPVGMNVTIELKPKSGHCNWPARKSFTAAAVPPKEVNETAESATLLQMSHTLIDDIAAKIRAEPVLTLKP